MLEKRLAPALALALLLSPPRSAGSNVLLVVADDLGVDKVGAYAELEGVPPDAAPPTPTLDSLAHGGLLFRNAWANPVCSTTRATIQTGRYSFRTGCGSAIPTGAPLPLSELTLAEALDLAAPGAVAQGAFGKWHLGGSAATAFGALNPNFQGYDRFAGTLGGVLNPPHSYFHWPKTVDGFTATSTAYATTDSVDDALDWIAAQSGSWLCYLAFHAPHTPFHAPPDELHGQSLPLGDPCNDPVPFYDAMVEAMDREIGRLLSSITPTTLADTTVVFLGDNGTDGFATLPPYDPDHAKGTLYEGGLKVPLIVHGPRVVEPGRQSLALVNTTDLFATVLELLGVDPAAQLPVGLTLDSRSLMPYVLDPRQEDLRKFAFAEHFFSPATGSPAGGPAPAAPPLAAASSPLGPLAFTGGLTPRTAPMPEGCGFGARAFEGWAIRERSHKLVRRADGTEELYDLLTDPRETDDLLTHPSLTPKEQAKLDGLRSQLDALLATR